MPLGNERRLTVAARHLVPHTSGTPFARRVPDVPLNAALNETRSRPKHFSQNLVFTIGSRNRFSPERNRLPPERKKTNHHHRKAGRAPRPPRFSFPARRLSNHRFAKLPVAPASRRRFFLVHRNRAFHAVRVRAQHRLALSFEGCAPACHDVALAQVQFFLDLRSLNTLQPPSSPANLPPIRSPPSLPLPPPPNPPLSKPTSLSSSALSSGEPLSSS